MNYSEWYFVMYRPRYELEFVSSESMRKYLKILVRAFSLAVSLVRIMVNWVQIFLLLPMAVFVVLARPYVLIRFGIIDASRIGHFCNTAGYLCLRDLGRQERRVLDFIGCSREVSNHQLKLMFARTLHIYPRAGLLGALGKACRLLTKSDLHQLEFAIRPMDLRFLETTDTPLYFTEEEHLRGRTILAQLGIPAGTPWVCLHNRDTAFLNEISRGYNWAYHNYRDFDVQSMVLCAEELANRGHYVLRMGALTEHHLISTNPKIIDYANHPARSEFADIYLLGNCCFYLGSDSGIFAVSTIFKRPFAFINFPVAQTVYDVYYWNPTPFILKRAWHRGKGRLLSLRELFEIGLANVTHTHLYEEKDVELICNTPEEIRDLAIEIDQRLKGQWQPQPEDEELQQRFWNILQQNLPHNYPREIKARIGASYLRKHSDLLD